MGGDVSVTLFEPLVLTNPMQIVTAHNDCLLHFGRHDDAAEQTTADGNVSGEGALLVDVVAVDCFARGFDAKPDVAEPPALLAAHAADQRHRSLLRERLVMDNVDFSHNDENEK